MPLDGGTMTPNSHHDGAYFHLQTSASLRSFEACLLDAESRPQQPPSPAADVVVTGGICLRQLGSYGRSLLLPDEKKSRIPGSYARHWQDGMRVPGDVYVCRGIMWVCNAVTHPVGTNYSHEKRGPPQEKLPSHSCAHGKEVEFHV